MHLVLAGATCVILANPSAFVEGLAPSGRPVNVEGVEEECSSDADRRRHILSMRFVWSAPAAQRFGQGDDGRLIQEMVADANAIADRVDPTVADANATRSDFGCCVELRNEGSSILVDPAVRVPMELNFPDGATACQFLHNVAAPIADQRFGFLVVSSLAVANTAADGFFCNVGQAPVRRGIIVGSASGVVLLHEVGHAQGLVHLRSETVDGETVFDPQDYVMATDTYDDFPGSNRHLHCYECRCYQDIPLNTEIGHAVSGECADEPPVGARDGGVGAEDDALLGCWAGAPLDGHGHSPLVILGAVMSLLGVRSIRRHRREVIRVRDLA